MPEIKLSKRSWSKNTLVEAAATVTVAKLLPSSNSASTGIEKNLFFPLGNQRLSSIRFVLAVAGAFDTLATSKGMLSLPQVSVTLAFRRACQD
jgi:hypothetical protein